MSDMPNNTRLAAAAMLALSAGACFGVALSSFAAPSSLYASPTAVRSTNSVRVVPQTTSRMMSHSHGREATVHTNREVLATQEDLMPIMATEAAHTVPSAPWTLLASLMAVPAALAAVWASKRRQLQSGAVSVGAAALLSAAPAMAMSSYTPLDTSAPSVATLGYVAEAQKLVPFLGMDTPPTSYGGYGGNANESPKYTFLRPEGWKQLPINKVQKGTQGVDSKVGNPDNKSQLCFTITLGRAGEDKRFTVSSADVDSTFRGFAGADYEFADALEYSDNIISSQRQVGDETYFDYEIQGEFSYLCTLTIKEGKVYAFFVKSPAKEFRRDEPMFREMVQSFHTLKYDGEGIAAGI